MIFPNAVLNAIILFISAGISALMAYFVWNRRKRSSATVPLVALMLSMTAWALPYAIFWLVTDSASRQFWIDVSYAGVVGVPASFFAFILAYTHHERWLTRRNVLLLCIEPVLCCLLLWTDSSHHLFTAGIRAADATAIKDGGIGYWGNFVYSYGLLALTFGILIRFVFTVQRAYRMQALTILFAALIPMVANVISIFQNVQYGLDPTAPAFTVSGLIFIYSLFYQKLLDFVPVARGKVIEMMRDSMIAVDERGRVMDVNPAAQRLLAPGGESVIGHPISEFLSRWTSSLNPEASARSALEVEVEQDGALNTYAISTSPLRDDQGRLQGQVLVLRDITEHKHVEEALRQSLVYRQAVFDSVNDSVFIFDADLGQIVDVNERLLELHGYTRAEIIGAPGTELLSAGIPPYDSEHAAQKLLLARTEGPQTFEWLARHKTKGTFWMEVRVRRALIGGSERFIVSSNDITMRKLAQERALELDKERDRIGLLRRFITDASHDFRTPLSTIGTSAYLLSKENLPHDRRERHSATIQEQVQHIIKLLDNFLEVARLDEESPPLTIHPLDANRIVNAVIALHDDEPDERDRIIFAPQTNLPLVTADEQALEQVVRQLVSNALNFTPEPGAIRVSTALEGDYAVIEVSDNGIGISAIDLPHIFDTFFRADAARSATTGGAGLGLSIVKRLVEGMHGSIDVKSKLREGSRFRVRLPLAQEKVLLQPHPNPSLHTQKQGELRRGAR
jgi:PAS domain S-box-containing protein